MTNDQSNSRTTLDADAHLSELLLGGVEAKDKHGLPTRVFLAGHEETEARAALARHLRGGPSSSVLQLLANLFDPDPGNALDAGDREISFKFRNRGATANPRREMLIAARVWHYRDRGMTEESAIAETAEALGIEEETVSSSWKKARKEARPVVKKRGA